MFVAVDQEKSNSLFYSFHPLIFPALLQFYLKVLMALQPSSLSLSVSHSPGVQTLSPLSLTPGLPHHPIHDQIERKTKCVQESGNILVCGWFYILE